MAIAPVINFIHLFAFFGDFSNKVGANRALVLFIADILRRSLQNLPLARRKPLTGKISPY
jgi:hypothetical protein